MADLFKIKFSFRVEQSEFLYFLMGRQQIAFDTFYQKVDA